MRRRSYPPSTPSSIIWVGRERRTCRPASSTDRLRRRHHRDPLDAGALACGQVLVLQHAQTWKITVGALQPCAVRLQDARPAADLSGLRSARRAGATAPPARPMQEPARLAAMAERLAAQSGAACWRTVPQSHSFRSLISLRRRVAPTTWLQAGLGGVDVLSGAWGRARHIAVR